MNYSDQYKDPRWQKMRLKILERDRFKCRWCCDDESQLHVHHTYYKKGRKVWDYPEVALITLCEECHEQAHELLEVCKAELGFIQYNHNYDDLKRAEEVLTALGSGWCDEEVRNIIDNLLQLHIHNKLNFDAHLNTYNELAELKSKVGA